jgi:hypothetical protein
MVTLEDAFPQQYARPLTAVHTTGILRQLNLRGTCNYHVFGPLKDTSTGRHFASGQTKEATHAHLVR